MANNNEPHILGINHLTVAVSDIKRSLAFYADILGMKPVVKWDHGAYLQAGDTWFCLSKGSVDAKQDYGHIAFSVTKVVLNNFIKVIEANGIQKWQENRSEGLSLYILDPDGNKLEIHAGSLESRLASLKKAPYEGLVWL